MALAEHTQDRVVYHLLLPYDDLTYLFFKKLKLTDERVCAIYIRLKHIYS